MDIKDKNILINPFIFLLLTEMIIVERSYSNPIRRITTIHRSTRLKSESLMTIRKPLILLPP